MNKDKQMALNRDESLALRGICISLVVLHNLIHNVVPFHENEKWFNIEFADYFVNNVANHPILGIISFVGWMGVPIFFFLCGYGLKLKYDKVPNRLLFVKKHYLKLLFLFGPVIVINNLHSHKSVIDIVGQLTFLDPIHRMLPAAFWYVCCAFEFYLLYAIGLYRIKPIWLVFGGGIVCLSLLFLDNMTVKTIKYHSVGWLLDFAMGCYVAVQPKCLEYLEKVGLVAVLFCMLALSIVNQKLWVVSDALMILFLLSIRRYLNVKAFVAIGTISAFLYAVHPIVRNLWLYWKLDYVNGNVVVIAFSVVTYFLACLLVAYAYRYVYTRFETYIKKCYNEKNES